MARKDILRRGFKADAERKASYFRQELNLKPYDPLCAFKLSEYLGIHIYKATDFLSSDDYLNSLKGVSGNNPEWSALTMITKKGNRIIIHNPFNSQTRQQSDIMHELAHIICEHKRSSDLTDLPLPFGMHEYNEMQEEEAKCLGSTLQLPTHSLLWAKKEKMKIEIISAYFNSSIEMVNYRMNITGIAKRKLKY